MTATPMYFRHSGRFRAAPTLAVLAAGLIAAAALGLVYGVLDFYIPLIYFNALMTVGVGFGIGVAVAAAARRVHLRQPLLAAALGLACGAAAEYAAFVGWVLAVFHWQAVIVGPDRLTAALGFLAERGVWGISKSGTVSGAALYGVWAIEAAIILGFAAVVPYRRLRSAAYCESCARWVDDQKGVGPFAPIGDPKDFRRRLEAGELSVLGTLAPASPRSADYSSLTLSRCATCDGLHLLTVKTVKTTYEKGKAKRTEKRVAENFLIDAEVREAVLGLQPVPEGQRPAPEAPAAGEDASAERDDSAAPGPTP